MKNLFTVLFLLGFALTVGAQTKSINKSPALTEGTPESVGMSSERLARIETMCSTAVEDGNLPGIVALVARNGKIVYYKAFGKSDNQSGRDLKRDDIFRIASQTKAITSTAVMMLWEEGKFRLDDPISKYIPEFKNPQILETFNSSDTSYTTKPATGEITIRQLLNHTSGLGYGIIGSDERIRMIYQKAGIVDAFSSENVTIGENIKQLAKLPLLFNPGEKYSYCEGLDVLGYFIEIVSGMPFDTFLRTRIFEPLGMNDTWFYLPEGKAPRLVSVQKPENGMWVRYPVTFYDPGYPVKGARKFFAGGAGLSSTAKDYATFLQMYLNGGELNGKRILSRTTVQFMMGNQNSAIWGDISNNYYALAFSVITAKGQNKGGQGSEGTFGWGGYFNTQYFADPKEKIIGILMKQTQGTKNDDTGWKFRQLVGQALDD
ncbi:MAG: beta-lactamase family protein [Prolixibacteraceae bacterium]|jgi:CubicO group peptidase (beta-lactamase class C family)|nr:beta-lactamase family protein [Prolixibacteraceae bacterium]